MNAYLVQRVIQGVFVIIIVSIIIFLMMRLLPGDPLQFFLLDSQITQLTDEEYQNLLKDFGLDKSIAGQYFDWVSQVFRGNLGTSLIYHDSVFGLLKSRFPVTLHLGILSFIVSTFLGIAAGVVCAIRRGGVLDTVVTSIANIGVSVPIFWLAIMMVYFIGLYLGWLPIQGYTSPFDDFQLSNRQLIMPVFCLSVVSLASNTRQTRSAMLEVIRQDYIRTAWSKGLSEQVIILRHALKNGLIPIITLLGAHVSVIFGGAVLVETVFNVPGMGRLLVNAVTGQDYAVVQACVLVISIAVVLVNLVVDISYCWLDPRIRYG
jgi:peptide/nickel transport system permease protein